MAEPVKLCQTYSLRVLADQAKVLQQPYPGGRGPLWDLAEGKHFIARLIPILYFENCVAQVQCAFLLPITLRIIR